MNFPNLKITQSENLVMQGVLSILVSAVLAGGSAGVQYVTRGGKIDVGVLASIVLAAFGFSFGSALHQYVPAHAKDLIQTYYDAANQAQQEAAHWKEQAMQTQSMQSALQEIKQQQAAVPTTVAQQVAAQVTANLQQVVAAQLPVPVETANNLLQGTDLAAFITSPQVPAIPPVQATATKP